MLYVITQFLKHPHPRPPPSMGRVFPSDHAYELLSNLLVLRVSICIIIVSVQDPFFDKAEEKPVIPQQHARDNSCKMIR